MTMESSTLRKSDPRTAIAADPPQLSDAEAIAMVKRYYGLEVTVRSLVSERDQNFEICTSDNDKFVFKIANHKEDPVVTDFQIEALLHIEDAVSPGLNPIVVPKVLRTLAGETQATLDIGGRNHVARIVTYVAGVPIGERIPSAALSRHMGAYLAHLGAALADFRHPGGGQHLLWDIQRSLDLRDIAAHIPKPAVLKNVSDALDAFEAYVIPKIAKLRRQVVHSDFNPDNVLTTTSTSDCIAGVIDFGDMLEAPIVADLAIAASYLRPADGDPLALIGEMVAGYARVTPLRSDEIDVLFEMIKARLCASIAILYWRASFRDSDDPYLGKLLAAESFAETFLARLVPIPRTHAITRFGQICASTAAPS